ncbi:hypothetical protein PHYBLDRAFT_167718 [Phycomyces blakesleeanus NRRL 1555(-)]|uniref:Uncharacterized protein n=1 Tax=Phycomyces blakesleeanus (strain ATCC 8743b / DSM 1359 / FGSC 10004 / NBRC 33097 / NRRL 1555) TaxID=763407 RepID=A0A163ALD6_PHYB8|nr:hypothetical protein PHYBLDRAFT_167718 [Phycomyces blakesleeanus NRRL 1555(-)]OAD74301.1 hypothetical protein PHYBLDRAFT_167718 [Phycomyces blakesleeanus NRRL 1555(-)]|eukprot:XP_018292341.1 hypothetical protein PHYBLDRAFT_167718 [Phycomyces blakesleeanus NRRL 1555(-)]
MTLEVAYAHLEARLEGGEAVTKLAAWETSDNIVPFLFAISDSTIPRLTLHNGPNHWALSVHGVNAALTLHFTRGNTTEAKVLYKAIGRIAYKLVQTTIWGYHMNGMAISLWSSLAPNQRNILVRSIEERASRRNIPIGRFENSWVEICHLPWKNLITCNTEFYR